MTGSDESGQSAGVPDPRPKRVCRPLTDHQWALLRIQYEQGGDEISYAKLSTEHNVSYSTLTKRAAEDGWAKTKDLVTKAGQMLAKKTDEKLAAAVDEAASKVSKAMMADLQPWIEQEKRAHIKRAIKRSRRGMKRLDRVAEGYEVFDIKAGRLVECETNPRDEMLIATAEDKYDGIIRRNLGMNDSSALSGSLSVRVLTDGAAIELKAG